ncbi:MAG TPA: tRNA (adenosine(37)-N6)-threonylcarbamoyltransferase complex dimerization subunit type 1 TsaB [Myxococcota bacterium]
MSETAGRAAPEPASEGAPRCARAAGPWLLAIESASEPASVALLHAGEPVGERVVPPGRPASEALLPSLLELLAAHGLEPAALDAIAVSIGPGSFTGLRVGVATAKGLAFGSEVAVAAVPTLAALAAKAAARGGPAALVVATLDARRGELYAAAHAGDDPLAPPRWGPAVVPLEALADRLAAEPGPLLLVGEGADALAAAVAARGGAPPRALAPPEGAPDATWVGRLGARLLAAGKGVAAAELAPVYVRRAEAEVRRTGLRFEPPEPL